MADAFTRCFLERRYFILYKSYAGNKKAEVYRCGAGNNELLIYAVYAGEMSNRKLE